MRYVMVFPDPSSEKGIAKYSLDLIKNIRKQGILVEECKFIQGKYNTLFRQLSKVSKYDLIHIQHEYNLLGGFGIPYFVTLGFLKMFRKNSLIVTMHTVLSQSEKFEHGALKTFLRKMLYKMQNKFIHWTADKIIVHAKSFKKILVNEYGIPSEKIIVLPHAILEDIKLVSKEKARKDLKLSGNVYLMIGTMVPDHGHDIALRQADEIGRTIVVATNPSAVNHRNEDKIKSFLALNQEIVKKNKFEKFVRFDLGPISYDKWWKYFAAADIILLPYRGGVGSGIFADAMAAKKPVVATNVRYFREFARDYGCVKLAKTESEIGKTVSDAMKPANYKKMVSEAQRYFDENGLTPISKKYKELYKSLL